MQILSGLFTTAMILFYKSINKYLEIGEAFGKIVMIPVHLFVKNMLIGRYPPPGDDCFCFFDLWCLLGGSF